MNLGRVIKASLGLNLVLLSLVAYQFCRPPSPAVSFRVPESQPPSNGQTEQPSPGQVEISNTIAPFPPAGRAIWSQIESKDYRTYMANLRAIGCPEQTIRDIILADVTKLYNERKTALDRDAKGPFTFWATDDRSRLTPAQSAELAEKLAQCERDKHAIIEQLLGSEEVGGPLASTEPQIEKQRRLAFLPPAKQNELRALDGKYPGIDEQIQAIVDVRSSFTDPQDLLQLLELYAQKKAALSQLLTPDEYEQYDLSASWTADNLRRKMVGFEPTEEEFRGIFRLWRAHDERLATVYALHQPEPGNEHIYAAIREFLGEERNDQYRQAWPGAPVPPTADPSNGSPESPPPGAKAHKGIKL